MAEIAGVCDVYCAMTRERPGGAAVSSQNALDSARGCGASVFGQSIVDQFVQCIGLYPVGTLVELNSGGWPWWCPRTASVASSRA